MAFLGSDVTHGTGPPPPGLHLGRFGTPLETDAGEAAFGAGTGEEPREPFRGVDAAADRVEAQDRTLIAGPAAPGSKFDRSFSGTGVELLGRVRSSQYTVPGNTLSAVNG